ncbi:MAG TPA: hypothetical protein PLH94_01465 [Fimbriimonadaceae bacterium]|nr:hypothetical protein [Fimbriimonadaceae bacterium]
MRKFALIVAMAAMASIIVTGCTPKTDPNAGTETSGGKTPDGKETGGQAEQPK